MLLLFTSQTLFELNNILSSISGAPKAVQSGRSWAASYNLSWYKKQEYFWDPINGFPGGTIYIGFWSPVNSSTRFGFAAQSGVESYYNEGGTILPCKKRGEWRAPVFTYDPADIVPAISEPRVYIINYTNITRYDGTATITWSDSLNSQSTTYLDINGNRVNQNSGDNSGGFDFSPKIYGVTEKSSYNTTVYRTNAYNGNTTVSDSRTLYTYTNPTLSNLTKTIPIINANQTETFSWVTNAPAWKSRNLENHILSMYINGNKITEINSGNEKNDITTIRVPNIGKYVNFDPSKLNGQTVDVKLVKSHANDSNVPEVSQTTQVIVRRIPTQYINKNSVVYRLVNSDGSIGVTLPEDAIVDRKKNKGIQVSFSYPSNTSTEHYGIVHGYRITIFADNNANIFQKDYDSTSLNFNTIIDVNSLKWSSKNKIRIQAYYRHSDTNYNKSTNGQIYLGPYIEKGFPTVITRLDKPTIDYPAQGSSWINNNYRILFQLPNDGDFNLYPSSISNNYIYRDIQVKITGGSTTVTYSWLNNPEIFSIDKTTYKAKVAINPSLISTHPIASSYTIQIRVRKNYGYPDATAYAEDSWSDWSDKRTFSIKSYSLFVNEGDYIMASHYKVMYDMISAMRNTYPTYNLKCKLVKRGDIILASDYDLVYQDIWSCYNTVNNWGKYGSTKNKVKFNQGNVIPSFNSNVGEFVTDLANDTKPVGRNYMIIMINDANLLK